MGRQYHGTIALEMDLLRSENQKLKVQLQQRTQQVIQLERKIVQQQQEAQAAQAEGVMPMGQDAGADSPNSTQKLLQSYRLAITKLKLDNKDLRIKLMHSAKKRKPAKQTRRKHRGGFATDIGSLKILLGLQGEAQIVPLLLPAGARRRDGLSLALFRLKPPPPRRWPYYFPWLTKRYRVV